MGKNPLPEIYSLARGALRSLAEIPCHDAVTVADLKTAIARVERIAALAIGVQAPEGFEVSAPDLDADELTGNAGAQA